ITSESRSADANIAAHLRSELSRDLLIGMYIGPSRANRKPILQLLTPGGETFAFAKVGLNPLTDDLVHREAHALSELAGARLDRLELPRLLHHGTWRGHAVLVETAFDSLPSRPDASQLGAAMSELSAVLGTERGTTAGSAYWSTLQTRLHSLPAGRLGDRLATAVDRLGASRGNVPLSFGSWHGDWTPWNMSMRHGRALVWDWERFETRVPIGFDGLHFSLQSAVVRRRTAPRLAAEQTVDNAAAILTPFGVGPAPATITALLYLADICARYLGDGQAQAGARLGNVDRWLLPALESRAAALDRAGLR
ncbi:MAG: hypothetical protein ACR2JQ_05235, partial [Mycobacteriales bacterium]